MAKSFSPDPSNNDKMREKGYQGGKYGPVSRGTTVWPIRFKHGDIDLANKVAETIGCSPSEAVRTSLRAYAVILDRVL